MPPSNHDITAFDLPRDPAWSDAEYERYRRQHESSLIADTRRDLANAIAEMVRDLSSRNEGSDFGLEGLRRWLTVADFVTAINGIDVEPSNDPIWLRLREKANHAGEVGKHFARQRLSARGNDQYPRTDGDNAVRRLDAATFLSARVEHLARDGPEWALRRDPDESDVSFERRCKLFQDTLLHYEPEDILFLRGIENPGLRFALREVLAHMRGGLSIHDVNQLEVADDWWETLSSWVDEQRGKGRGDD